MTSLYSTKEKGTSLVSDVESLLGEREEKEPDGSGSVAREATRVKLESAATQGQDKTREPSQPSSGSSVSSAEGSRMQS